MPVFCTGFLKQVHCRIPKNCRIFKMNLNILNNGEKFKLKIFTKILFLYVKKFSFSLFQT